MGGYLLCACAESGQLSLQLPPLPLCLPSGLGHRGVGASGRRGVGASGSGSGSGSILASHESFRSTETPPVVTPQGWAAPDLPMRPPDE